MLATHSNQASDMRYQFIHLWLASSGPKNNRPRQLESDPSPSPQSATRILIVEDEIFVAWHLEDTLRDLKFEVCGIMSEGEEAIGKVSEMQIDLILMDIRLGGKIDGIETAQRIRQNSNVGIIFITAYSDAATLNRIQAQIPGAPVLIKPASSEKLQAAIAEVVERTRRQ